VEDCFEPFSEACDFSEQDVQAAAIRKSGRSEATEIPDRNLPLPAYWPFEYEPFGSASRHFLCHFRAIR
jgi:hypothetical protein